jgi:dinuclear metal center YbgI/SA1388 family protein
MITRAALTADLDRLLESPRFRDYGPNGLQVEGRAEVRRLATAATASLAACRAAAAAGADALLVHHGLLWGRCEPITGPLRARLAVLLQADMSLLAYHLPLDAHAEHGNNAVALARLGAVPGGAFAEHKGMLIGRLGNLPVAEDPTAFSARLQTAFAHPVLHCPGASPRIQRIGVVTGGGQGHLLEAAAAGCDALVAGEASEQSWHEAAESGCHLFACGHHATEDLAVHALGALLAERHGLAHVPLHLPNPV